MWIKKILRELDYLQREAIDNILGDYVLKEGDETLGHDIPMDFVKFYVYMEQMKKRASEKRADIGLQKDCDLVQRTFRHSLVREFPVLLDKSCRMVDVLGVPRLVVVAPPKVAAQKEGEEVSKKAA